MPQVPSLVAGTVVILLRRRRPHATRYHLVTIVAIDAASTPALTLSTQQLDYIRISTSLPPPSQSTIDFRAPRHRRSSAAAAHNDLNCAATFQPTFGTSVPIPRPFSSAPRRQYPSKSLRCRRYQRIAYPMLVQNCATDSNMTADSLRRFKLRCQLQFWLSVSQTGPRSYHLLALRLDITSSTPQECDFESLGMLP
ncbi:hypothetical protein C8R43DRAFT_444355 [Mycena crocata]|nr:hypothetical protein C8R43DRAFT_444355 [Mycena crocata]